MAVSTLFKFGDEIYKVVSPYIKRYLTEKGAKPVSKIAADKINKNPSTITNVNQIKPKGRANLKPTPKVVKPMSGVTSSQRSALSNMGGQTVKLSKPTGGTGRANLKPKTPSVKAERPSVKAERPSVKPKPRVVKPSAASPKPSASAAKPRPKITTQPPKKSTKPITPGRAARIGGTTAVITGAALLGNKGQKKSGAGTSTVTGPKSRPSRNAPNYGMPKAKTEGKDPRGNQIKPTPGKTVMPKKFQGSYNKDTHKLSNITIDGKKSTYVLPKNMTSSKAKSLLTGTIKKYDGGRLKRKNKETAMEKVKRLIGPAPKRNYAEEKQRRREYLNRSKAKPSTKTVLDLPLGRNEKARLDRLTAEGKINFPSKINKPKPKAKPKKPDGRRQYPIKPTTRKPKPIQFKGGGSVGSSKVARQVRGFGAARKPKK